MPCHPLPRSAAIKRLFPYYWLMVPVLCFLLGWGLTTHAAETDAKGLFLIATEHLNGTGFQQTVIFVTHLSPNGATGLAINRPTDIPINHAVPKGHPLREHKGRLFLGGPVNPSNTFLILQTKQPTDDMYPVVNDIYFTTAHADVGLAKIINLRIFAGYSGWGPGQLQAEIDRGDWLTIKTDPNIVFDADTAGLWLRLYQMKSANWI
jgi:putative transcriptional regulator